MPVDGTLGAKYLAHRSIELCFDDLRYHPRCPKGRAPATKFVPALLVAVREHNQLRAIQRIFLAPDGRRHDKMMIGRPSAGAWKGRAATETLAISEGFETAACFTQATGHPCWASLGAARLELLALPHTLGRLIIAEDNDDEGAAAARRAVKAYSRPGLEIIRMRPPQIVESIRKDWADIAALAIATA